MKRFFDGTEQVLTIQTEQLKRDYSTYKKQEGLLNSIRGLWKREHIEKHALLPTDLEIESGQIIGLVGANGAGKTTLLKLLSGLIHPSGGSAKVLGYTPWERHPDFLKRISLLLGQKNQLWWDIPPLDSFGLLAQIYDLDTKATMARARELADILECRDQLDIQLRRLSLGERMKMEIIGSLLHKPDVLFLDEPTIGLDVMAQTRIREFLATYVKEYGPTVILTSHYMDDIAQLSDRLLLISGGKIVYDGDVDAFTRTTGTRQTITMVTKEPFKEDYFWQSKVVAAASGRQLVAEVEMHELADIVNLVSRQHTIQDIKIEETNFEDVIRQFLAAESRARQTRNPN